MTRVRALRHNSGSDVFCSIHHPRGNAHQLIKQGYRDNDDRSGFGSSLFIFGLGFVFGIIAIWVVLLAL